MSSVGRVRGKDGMDGSLLEVDGFQHSGSGTIVRQADVDVMIDGRILMIDGIGYDRQPIGGRGG
jgi:hypothetical protein